MADSSVSRGIAFWKDTERLAKWSDHPHTQEARREKNAPTTGGSLSLAFLEKWMPSVLKKCAAIQLKHSWMIPSVVFVLAVALQTKVLLSSKFSRNLRSLPKFHVLFSSSKHTTESLVKSFGKCCESTTVLTATCYWPSSHCILCSEFVSVSAELNRNRSPWLLYSDKCVCCHHFSS